MLKKAFLNKVNQEAAPRFTYFDVPHQQLEVIKHNRYKVALTKKKERYYLATSVGVSEFEHVDAAVDSLLKICTVIENIGPMRKATMIHFQKNVPSKVSRFIKLCSNFEGDDKWINSAEDLIHTSTRELWALTSDNQYIARLFEPNSVIQD